MKRIKKFKNRLKRKIKKLKNQSPKIFETFTKLWVSILLIVSVIDLQLSYLLAYLGREQIAESLSVAVVTEIIGVITIYMIRAYFDTRTEKKHDLEVRKFECGIETPENEDFTYDETEN